jgi:hypothetical protein
MFSQRQRALLVNLKTDPSKGTVEARLQALEAAVATLLAAPTVGSSTSGPPADSAPEGSVYVGGKSVYVFHTGSWTSPGRLS